MAIDINKCEYPKTRQFYYTFKYPFGGGIVKSGGNDGICIVEEINHNETKIGDMVMIMQFNISGSYPTVAEIIGKVTYDWDMSKPIGQRKSNEKTEGIGY